jgi:hypothetical protein
MGKERWLAADKTPHPGHCIPFMSPQSFVFPCRLLRLYSISALERGVQR